jgi:hypothetical protein
MVSTIMMLRMKITTIMANNLNNNNHNKDDSNMNVNEYLIFLRNNQLMIQLGYIPYVST